MYPHERSLVRRFAREDFAIVGVNSDADKKVALAACHEHDLSWRSFWNGSDGPSSKGGIAEEWNVVSWPMTYLIDGECIIRFKGLRGAPLERAIEAMLADREKAPGGDGESDE